MYAFMHSLVRQPRIPISRSRASVCDVSFRKGKGPRKRSPTGPQCQALPTLLRLQKQVIDMYPLILSQITCRIYRLLIRTRATVLLWKTSSQILQKTGEKQGRCSQDVPETEAGASRGVASVCVCAISRWKGLQHFKWMNRVFKLFLG